MTIRRGARALFLAGLATAIVFVLVPAAAAYDPLEFPLAVDAMNTYSPEPLAAPTNDGKHDMAVGGGQHGVNGVPDCMDGDCVKEGFSAHSGPSGEDPKGKVSASFNKPKDKLRGPVLCLDVQGNEAWILVMQTEDAADQGFPEGQPFLLHVVDNGKKKEMEMTPDLIANIGPGEFLPGSFVHPCGYSAFAVPLQKGNITVRDV